MGLSSPQPLISLLPCLSNHSLSFFLSTPTPLRLSAPAPTSTPTLLEFLSHPIIFSYSLSSSAVHFTVAPKINDSLESILRNAEGLLSYLASNIETLLGDIDPEGLKQAKKEILKVGKGIGSGSGSGRGRDVGGGGGGGGGVGVEGEAKQGIRKGNIT